jgi:YihY family inner membrane protein
VIPQERLERLRRFRPTARYMFETEAHVYALAIAASVLLSFFPFIIVMVSFCKSVLHWQAAVDAIFLALEDYFPGDLSNFVRRNVLLHSAPLGSMVLLLLTANGVFEPLEVALNRVWCVGKNRPYWKNQLVAFGLIFACGALVLLSLMFTALNLSWVPAKVAESSWSTWLSSWETWLNVLVFKLAAIPLSIFALFLIYWLLPNCKIDPRKVAPAAIIVGLLLEALKYLDILLWHYLEAKLQKEYGPFQHSALILLWSFAGGLIVLAGAEWSARRAAADQI